MDIVVTKILKCKKKGGAEFGFQEKGQNATIFFITKIRAMYENKS